MKFPAETPDAFDESSAEATRALELARELLTARASHGTDPTITEETLGRVLDELYANPRLSPYLVVAQLHLAYTAVTFVVATEAGATPDAPIEMETPALLAAIRDVTRRLIAASLEHGWN